MRTLAHISDLHFGCEDPRVVEALQHDLAAARPDLLCVSGDLTQRAKESEFTAARAFLDAVDRPRLVVPGNHDIPLYDITRRLFAPRERYQRVMGGGSSPVFRDSELAVLGIDTTSRLRWKEGEVKPEHVARIQQTFCGLPERVFRVLVLHHPFVPPSDDPRFAIVGGASEALDALERCGAELLLSGHLHLAYSGDVRTHHLRVQRSILIAQAGTAVSKRGRGEPNAYNLVELERDEVRIHVRAWNGERFVPHDTAAFRRRAHAWERLDVSPPRGSRSQA